jgi:hypothetical protein
MTSSVSYHARRTAWWQRYLKELDQLVRESTFEKNWERPSILPHVPVTEELAAGLLCLYAGDRERGDVFLRRAADFADRLIREQRYLDTEVAESGHPRNYARIIAGWALARWLLGEPLDRSSLREAAGDMVTWCRTKAQDRRRFNDSLTMTFYVQGVRLALISCDLDYAGTLLQVRDRFRWHHGREVTLWRRLVEMYPDVSDEFDDEVERFFDVVRDPDFSDSDEIGSVCVDRDAVALETGIIREMYIMNASPHDDPDANEVVRAVGR